MDGIPLDAIVQERYLLSGSYDAEKFASGDYVLAVVVLVYASSISCAAGICSSSTLKNSLRSVFSGHCCRNTEAGITKLMQC